MSAPWLSISVERCGHGDQGQECHGLRRRYIGSSVVFQVRHSFCKFTHYRSRKELRDSDTSSSKRAFVPR